MMISFFPNVRISLTFHLYFSMLIFIILNVQYFFQLKNLKKFSTMSVEDHGFKP